MLGITVALPAGATWPAASEPPARSAAACDEGRRVTGLIVPLAFGAAASLATVLADYIILTPTRALLVTR